MILIFKADNEFQAYLGFEDERVLSELENMGEKELDATEIAIYERPEGDSVRFELYPDGTYKCMEGGCLSGNAGPSEHRLELASYQVIKAQQYNLLGRRVTSCSEGRHGKVTGRELTPIGVRYLIQADDGTFFHSFDADLEV